MIRVLACSLLAVTLAGGQMYEHVVITSRTFAPHYAPLCSTVEALHGFEDTVVMIEDIRGALPGRDDPEKIRNFIRYAYDEWLTMYVLIGGDADVVPCRYAWGDRGSGQTELVPCDLYYADLDGDWDADHDNVFGEPEDSVDLYPDVHVGRFVASDAASADLLVGKFLRYTDDPDDPYLENVFLDGMDLYEWCLAEEAMEFYDSTLVPETMKPCTKVYDSHGGNHRDSMLYYLEQGQHIWVHSDHSNWNCLGAGWTNHRELLMREDLAGLANGDDLAILMTNGCSAGAFDSSDCATEHFLLAPEGGGVAAFTNTRTGLLDRNKPLHGQSFMQIEELLRAFFGHPRHGELSDLATVQALVAPLAATSARYRYTHYQFTLFGDPAMPVWIPRQSGVEEEVERGRMKDEGGPRSPTIVRGVLRAGHDWFPPGEPGAAEGGCRSSGSSCPKLALLDITGRKVVDLQPGENDVSGLAPGVYFTKTRERTGTAKVLVVR